MTCHNKMMWHHFIGLTKHAW